MPKKAKKKVKPVAKKPVKKARKAAKKPIQKARKTIKRTARKPAQKSAPKPPQYTKRPEVGIVGKAFKANEGMCVWMLRVGKEADQEMLVKFYNLDHKWNQKIFKTKVVNSSTGFDCQIQVNNAPYTIITARRPWGTEYEYEAYLPDMASSMKIYYTEDGTREIVPEHFLTEFLKQEGINL